MGKPKANTRSVWLCLLSRAVSLDLSSPHTFDEFPSLAKYSPTLQPIWSRECLAVQLVFILQVVESY